MKQYLKIILVAIVVSQMPVAHAGIELVCKGSGSNSSHRIVYVDCSNRRDFVEKLGAAWRTLRQNSIGGTIENLCWEAYNQARDMHPSISFENISDSFLMRCNMGLEHVN